MSKMHSKFRNLSHLIEFGNDFGFMLVVLLLLGSDLSATESST